MEFERPFYDAPVQKLDASHEIIIRTPADDESKGLVQIGWRGPKGKVIIYAVFCIFVLNFISFLCLELLRANGRSGYVGLFN